MEPLVRVPVAPGASFHLPPKLEGLRRLAYNLWWSWHPNARVLFSRIDAGAWARYRNPIPVLSGPVAWDQLLNNTAFMADYEEILREFDAYMANGADHWFARQHGDDLQGPIAYFCAEYGFHESLGIYSGGLGVLAGDHMKTASDMALPLVGVGLMYRKGYFRQTIDADGHQEHAYPDYELSRLPILRALDRLGRAAHGEPAAAGPRPVRRRLGRPGGPRARSCCSTPTSPTTTTRTARSPTSCTSAAARCASTRSWSWASAASGRCASSTSRRRSGTSTRATPRSSSPSAPGSSSRPAGRSTRRGTRSGPTRCSRSTPRSRRATSGSTRTSCGGSRRRCWRATGDRTPAASRWSEVLELGLGVEGDDSAFDMTAFSLRMTRGANAVSLLHGQTANATWRGVMPHDILGITNGVHTPTWLGQPMREAFERYSNANLDRMDDMVEKRRFWDRIDQVPAEELWEAHQRQKLELAIFARGRLRSQFARHGESPTTLEELEEVLDPSILTIGFARRFATYKRAALLFTDIERLARMLWDEERPLQIIFAGKAHPADRPGQGVIQDIFGRSRSPRLRGRVFIMEDYDIRIGRFLVQGVDVWLNNPRRPLEASGTSGMKASANGIPNLSVLDGWWDEGWTGDNGWAIGGRDTNPDEGAQDWADAQDLYRILEEELIPAYYDRTDGLPERWIQLMRNAIASNIWRFSTTRMLHEYVERLYLPGTVATAGTEAAAPPEAAPAGATAGS